MDSKQMLILSQFYVSMDDQATPSSNKGWSLHVSINFLMFLRDMRYVCKNSASFNQGKSSESKKSLS